MCNQYVISFRASTSIVNSVVGIACSVANCRVCEYCTSKDLKNALFASQRTWNFLYFSPEKCGKTMLKWLYEPWAWNWCGTGCIHSANVMMLFCCILCVYITLAVQTSYYRKCKCRCANAAFAVEYILVMLTLSKLSMWTEWWLVSSNVCLVVPDYADDTSVPWCLGWGLWINKIGEKKTTKKALKYDKLKVNHICFSCWAYL